MKPSMLKMEKRKKIEGPRLRKNGGANVPPDTGKKLAGVRSKKNSRKKKKEAKKAHFDVDVIKKESPTSTEGGSRKREVKTGENDFHS